MRLAKLISWILFGSSLVLLFQRTYQLECYVCQNQDNNQNKCVETLKTCDLEQEQCLTEVRWGSAPFWALSEQRQYFISKRCATKYECQEAIADRSGKCDRIWYNDWNCTSCCNGDKCNYFVTLAAQNIEALNPMLLTTGCLFATISFYLQANVLRVAIPSDLVQTQ